MISPTIPLSDCFSSSLPGLGIYWLAATVGSSSAFKKLSKKEIMDCNIPKAVDKLIHPEEPLVSLHSPLTCAFRMHGATMPVLCIGSSIGSQRKFQGEIDEDSDESFLIAMAPFTGFETYKQSNGQFSLIFALS